MESTGLAGLSKGRIEALTDGIFATVMTVLILSLSVPVITGSQFSHAQISSALVLDVEGLAPNILSYVMSFVILGVFWMRHHNMFHFITRVDRSFLWLNMGFLLTIGFIPFSTALIGRYPLIQVSVIVYGANLIATTLCMQFLWLYSTRRKLLPTNALDEAVMSRINRRTTAGPIMYFIAILLSIVSNEISIAIYIVVLVYLLMVSVTGFGVSRKNAGLPHN